MSALTWAGQDIIVGPTTSSPQLVNAWRFMIGIASGNVAGSADVLVSKMKILAQ